MEVLSTCFEVSVCPCQAEAGEPLHRATRGPCRILPLCSLPRDATEATACEAGGAELPRLAALGARPQLTQLCHLRGGVEEQVGGREGVKGSGPLIPWQRLLGSSGS